MKFKQTCPLPAPLLAMLTENRKPTEGRYGVNELIGPPRIAQLRRRHFDELEVDPLDQVWMLFGKLLHKQLEYRAEANALAEEKIIIDLLERKVAGVPDHYEETNNGTLTDYKFCSVYVAGELRPDWIKELNFHAHLLRSCGFAVNKLQVCMIYRDWSQTKSENDPHYPPRIQLVNVPLWPIDATKMEIEQRMGLHKMAELLSDNSLPVCTDEERWMSPLSWAVIKPGRSKATKVFRETDGQSRDQAVDMAQAIGGSVEDRPKEYRRCPMCDVRDFCNVYQGELLLAKTVATGAPAQIPA